MLHINSVHHNSVIFVQGSHIGLHFDAGSTMKGTVDDWDDDTKHNNDNNNRGRWISTVRRGSGTVLGRAHTE